MDTQAQDTFATSRIRHAVEALCQHRPFRRLAGRSHSSEDGQALVEFALTLPLIAGFIFTMIEICLTFYSYCMISECAREGTRYAIVHGGSCVTPPPANASCSATAAQVETYVAQIGFPNLAGGTMSSVASFADQNPKTPVQVTVTYTFPIRLPFVSARAVSMSSTSVMRYVQ